MSADNGIYILKTRDDQYRVTHAQTIENIFDIDNPKMYDPIEVVWTWKDCRYTKNKEIAYKIAERMEERFWTEYGIRLFEYKKIWKHIVEDAKKKAETKIEIFKKYKHEYTSSEKYQLKKCYGILLL